MKEENDKIPFTKQSSKASWVIPLLTLIIMYFTNSSVKNASSPFAPFLIGGMVILFYLLGTSFSIIGLLGIKNHGTKGLLVPSIIGLILNIGFLSLFLFIIYVSFQKYQNG
jgi:hypothetical protein